MSDFINEIVARAKEVREQQRKEAEERPKKVFELMCRDAAEQGKYGFFWHVKTSDTLVNTSVVSGIAKSFDIQVRKLDGLNFICFDESVPPEEIGSDSSYVWEHFFSVVQNWKEEYRV